MKRDFCAKSHRNKSPIPPKKTFHPNHFLNLSPFYTINFIEKIISQCCFLML
jgi:hypothetical protein